MLKRASGFRSVLYGAIMGLVGVAFDDGEDDR